DPDLGKVVLYQLSYFRKTVPVLRYFWLRLGKENKFSLLSPCTKIPQWFQRTGLQIYGFFLNLQIFCGKNNLCFSG
ncbi:MAG: hypothetical protein J5835_05810, partial [Bacteroidales bacterium]|nr:hypothetical protein [Bacteroidales bacterium]